MYEVAYTCGQFYALSDDDSYGPYHYAAEAQEKCDELNEE